LLSQRFRAGRFLLFVTTLALMSALTCIASANPPLSTMKSFKVLAIGNSFSTDAMQHLYQIAAEAGAENIVIANLYVGSASLTVHRTNAQGNLANYRYDKNDNGTWRSESNRTLLYGLQDEDWDVITLQQVSGQSGVETSYAAAGDLQYLIDYVNKHKTNSQAKLVWHMTWAYESTSTHGAFSTYYGRDQLLMYKAIAAAVQKHIVPNTAFAMVIPSGTAVQNVRTSFIGDTLTCDGYHLSNNLGRYIAGLTWFYALTGQSIDGLTWVPSSTEIPSHFLPVIKEAVKAAIETPFAVTPSSYDENPVLQAALTMEGYELLDWQPVGCSHWNATSANPTRLNTRENSDLTNLCYFVSSGKMFTREDIPIGSIIEIDEGYQYRPEGWVTLTRQPSANRPTPVREKKVVVTEEWWGDFVYRSFNVSFIGSKTDVRGIEEETASHFRIWVPKQ
jgi:hypothetical protein